MKLVLEAFEDIPEIQARDNLSLLIARSSAKNNWQWQDGDVIVLAQKIVSKAEGRQVHLSQVEPSKKAIAYSKSVMKDPRLIELILQESKRVIRTRGPLMIVQHKLGFICANAGIDHSNVGIQEDGDEGWVLLLPENPDLSAQMIRTDLIRQLKKEVAVMIIDSHGRPWRKGIVGVCIGLSGLPGVIDLRGSKDRNGYTLRVTEISTADELAAAASLMMGQANEGRPVVVARGFPYPFRASRLEELIREEDNDLFR